MRQVYLDHAAATPLNPKVLSAMLPFLKTNFYNPSGLYSGGVQAAKAINKARAICASVLKTNADSIYFAASGTESTNLAILGICNANAAYGRHIVTTEIEHHAVLEPIKHLEANGFSVTYLKPNRDGLVTAEQVLGAIRKDTILVSVMYANNEIGTILPVHDIGRSILRYRRDNNTVYPYFFSDACQAAGYLDIHVDQLHVDALAVNASKVYGPKGAAMLYVRRGTKLEPITFGGSQEKTLRPGTENVAAAVGLAEALAINEKIKSKESMRLKKLSKYFVSKLPFTLNGPLVGDLRLPNNVNLTIPHIDAETFVLYLDKAGIQCSTGSACTAISATPSHVLSAIGKSADEVKSSVRFTLGRSTTKADIDFVVKNINKILKLLK